MKFGTSVLNAGVVGAGLAACLTVATAGDEKPAPSAGHADSMVLLDEADTIAKWTGAGVSREHVKSGKVAAKWGDHPHHGSFSCTDIPHDWSAYDALTFRAYSEKANRAKLMLTITSENAKSDGWDYFNAPITVDWKGWKHFTLVLERMGRTRSPIGWTKIDSIAFNASGWGHRPRADTVLYFDDMRLVRLPRITKTVSDVRAGCLYELDTPVTEGEAVAKVQWLDGAGHDLPVRVTVFTVRPRPEMGPRAFRRRYVAPVGAVAARVVVIPANERPVAAHFTQVMDLTAKGLDPRRHTPVDPAGPVICKRLIERWDHERAPDRSVERLMKSQIMDPNSPGFGSWGKYETPSDFGGYGHSGWFAKIRDFARCYTNPRSKWHHDPEVLRHLEAGLRFGLRFIGVGKPRPGNWWDWDIGPGLSLTPALVLAGDALNPAPRAAFVQSLYDLGWNCKGAGFAPDKIASGANGLWVVQWGLRLAAYTSDPQLLSEGQWVFERNNRIAKDGGDGIQPDGSYHFHGPGLHFGYGPAHLGATGEYLYLTQGTQYSLPPEALDNYLRFFSFAVWNSYRGLTNPYSIGRGIAGGCRSNAAMSAALWLLAAEVREDESEALAAVADYCRGTRRAPSSLGWRAEKAAGKLKTPAPPVVGVRYYPWSDYMIARTPAFFAAVRMCSTRTKGWFSIWEQNLRGYYSGEGTVALMTDGREYRDRAVFVSLPWDNLTGITRVVGLHPDRERLGQSPLAVGAALDRIGCCGMDYRLAKGDRVLTAHKTYFAFNDTLALLGSDVHGENTDADAKTVLLMLPVQKDADTFTVDGRTMPLKDGASILRGVHWFFYRNIGVVLPEPGDLEYRCETRTKDMTWVDSNPNVKPGRKFTRRFITLRVNHGRNPKTGGYAALLLPATTAETVRGAVESAPVRIIERGTTVHAASAADGTAGAALFFKPGRCKVGGLSRPGILVWHRHGDKIDVAVYAEKKGLLDVILPATIAPTSLSSGVRQMPVQGPGAVLRVSMPGMAPVRFFARTAGAREP